MLCAIPIVREVVPTDVNIRVRRMRPSAVRERRSWAIGGHTGTVAQAPRDVTPRRRRCRVGRSLEMGLAGARVSAP